MPETRFVPGEWRVAFVVGHYLTPTLEETFLELAEEAGRHLSRAEIWQVYWWPGVPSSPLVARAREAGVKVREFWLAGPVRQARTHGWWRGWGHWWATNRAALRAMRAAARNGSGHFALCLLHAPWFAELAVLLGGRPRRGATKYFTATEWPVPWHKRLAYFLISLALDRVVVNSPEAGRFARLVGHLPARLEVLRAVDVVSRRFDQAKGDGARARALWGIPLEAPVVGAVSRLDPVKGHETLLDCWPGVVARHPEAVLLVVGGSYGGEDDPYAGALKERAERLGIAGSVRFTGMRADVLDHYLAMELLAHPSAYDLFPFSVLEAMGLGLPVVASAVGGIPEMIADGEDGVLVPPGNPAALARALSALLSDPDRRARLGAAAAARVAGKWTVERAALESIDLYNRILAERGGRWP